MGWFDDIIGNPVKRYVNQVVTNPVESVVNPLSPMAEAVSPGSKRALDPLQIFNKDKEEQQAPPGVDPALFKLQQEQLKQAEEFQKNSQGLKERGFAVMAGKEKQRLADEMAGITTGMNRRGLLYSGTTEGLKGKAKADATGRLAQGREQFGAQVESEGDRLRMNAINTGVQIQGLQQGVQNQIYQQAMAERARRAQGLGAILGAAGMVGGAMATGGNPMGAMAGYQAGSAIGQSQGGM